MKTVFNANIICRLVCFEERLEKSMYMNPPAPGDIISLSGKEYRVASVTDNGTVDGFGEYDPCVTVPIQCYNVVLTLQKSE